MRLNPRREVEYRIRIAVKFLEEAEKAWGEGDWRRVVEASQLSSENAVKAVMAIHRVLSWSHDPYEELTEVSSTLSPGAS